MFVITGLHIHCLFRFIHIYQHCCLVFLFYWYQLYGDIIHISFHHSPTEVLPFKCVKIQRILVCSQNCAVLQHILEYFHQSQKKHRACHQSPARPHLFPPQPWALTDLLSVSLFLLFIHFLPFLPFPFCQK